MKSKVFANFLNISSWKLTPYQILTLGFAGLILLGAFLLMLPISNVKGEVMPFIDALFTATSAVCVTGLIVIDTGTYFSLFGQLVIIGLIQSGGFGIMTMATLMAVIMRKRLLLKNRLIMQEALNQLTVEGIVRLTLYIIKLSLLIEFIGGTILAVRFYQDFGMQGVYFGYWHAVSAFCNAGFDIVGTANGNLFRYVDDIVINLIITGLIILGGLGFTVIADVISNKQFKKVSLHSKIVLSTTAFLIVFGTLGIFLLESGNSPAFAELSLQGKILASYFQAVSARTAGFNTVFVGDLTEATLFFIIILMFVGASPGSTGGGIKTTTFAIIVASIWGLIRGRNETILFYRHINPAIVYKAFAIFFIAATLVVTITMLLCAVEPVAFIKILFEVVSAFGTVGSSTGITGDLTSYSKAWLIITMFAGRVGPVTFALALAMRNKKTAIQYPEGKVTIG